ncbi:hypothetical protein X928_03850 [Petrotoga miotherma DSM 10691]|jgi:hypothetical protein|uniref:Uncharacterized protein n=2 Tax=Petrotoga TaxID=28236 RepID=A0A2K1PE09_9BACT|nr:MULTISPECIES: hypothetical protein [Petrotoga]PNS01031.1 hypothetical protein X928_03850 [Petrotoga miotherma DSM 10691]POZ93328.1 hypothetical protein AA81_02370 [Petrotoga halophila DSM 16923]
MKRFYYVFFLLVVSMFLFTSCALEEIELKTDPTIQAPIATESITMSDLVDTEDIVSSLEDSFGSDATVTHKSTNPLTYGVDLKIFDGQEILDKIPGSQSNFSDVPVASYDLVTSDASLTLVSLGGTTFGSLGEISLTSLPATLVVIGIDDPSDVTIEATLTTSSTSTLISSGEEFDLGPLFNEYSNVYLDEMTITFTSSLAADASPTIKLLVDIPFEFTITEDVELFTNKDEVGDEDIFGRSGEDSDDLSDILDGIESLKLHMNYDNTTGLPLKMEVQGWDVENDGPTASGVKTEVITVGEDKTVAFVLTDLIEDMKDTVPFNLVFTVKLPSSTYSLNMDGSLDLSLWLDLDTDLTIPITLRAQ